jgi:hypothetical protein
MGGNLCGSCEAALLQLLLLSLLMMLLLLDDGTNDPLDMEDGLVADAAANTKGSI